MSEYDESKVIRPEGEPSPGAYEDTVVEILSLGDGEEDEAERAEGAGGDPQDDLADLHRLEALLAAERERSLRLRADFDNFRKRSERERGEVERYALADVLRDLLPVVDNLERALEAQGVLGQDGATVDMRKGFEMIVRQFQEILKRYGLLPIPALGERFDPAVHEAVFHEESDAVTVPTVAVELQRGYRLNDRLLRPSLVKVAVPRESTADMSASDPSK